MTKNFYECAKNGGKVVSKRDKDGKKIKICYDKNNKPHVKKQTKNEPNKDLSINKPTAESLKQLIEHFNLNY